MYHSLNCSTIDDDDDDDDDDDNNDDDGEGGKGKFIPVRKLKQFQSQGINESTVAQGNNELNRPKEF